MDEGTLTIYNKMHADYCVRRMGICGLKRKLWRLVKQFDATKPKHSQLFRSVAMLMNFIYRCKMQFIQDIVDEQLDSPLPCGWDGDY